ncbi:prepilin peptidase [Arthrobacter sp. UM1]|uniref:prepilin peptidase n=1 Tax=Arthrobacter sp. UM1 TaxID=2766776 RepID=UPI001CF6D47D|nr:A24 family peptidase [Arthrobacter sp. UM1]MCB4207954.1 prepilin peptidase [Arthrobacter sp. UM1]
MDPWDGLDMQTLGLAGWGAVVLLVLTWALVGTLLWREDLRSHRLPRRPVWMLGASGVFGWAVVSTDSGSPWPAVSAALGGGLSWASGLALRAAGRGALGRGDVRLSGALGLVTGGLGWAVPLAGLTASLLLGGAWALALVLTGRARGAHRIPFGPFLLAGAAVAAVAWGSGTSPGVA